jgi:hypothetical protein
LAHSSPRAHASLAQHAWPAVPQRVDATHTPIEHVALAQQSSGEKHGAPTGVQHTPPLQPKALQQSDASAHVAPPWPQHSPSSHASDVLQAEPPQQG